MNRISRRCARAMVVVLALLVLDPFSLRAEEVIEWRNVPVSIVLTVGEERVLAFPDHVEVGVPSTLTGLALRIQSTGGTVLWLARQPFPTQRIQVRLLTTGHVMLFDVTAVSAASGGSAEPVRVVFPDSALLGASEGSAAASSLTPVTLTRFAAQQLYAPERVLRDIPGLRRVPMGVPASIELYRHESIAAQPLASWQGGGYYITAVKLTNLAYERILLDPRELRGHFVTATFQHNSLGPRGAASDVTCVYLVTDRPFAETIVAALPIDAVEED